MASDAHQDWEVVVVGAGAAGLMAAIRAAELGRRTLLLEKNTKPGVKILMSGGTRCNITQNTDSRGIVEAFGPPGRFLHSALAALGVRETIEIFNAEGVATKVESTGKIFPVSNKATDVLGALVRRLARSGATLALGQPLVELGRRGEQLELIAAGHTFRAPRVILTTGGVSYPGCGTTGDGYRWASQFGHSLVEPRPALVPVTVEAPWVRALKGVTVVDVAVAVVSDGQDVKARATRPLASRRGSFLFTHFGLSGPVVLDVSKVISGHPRPSTLALECDFLPQLSRQDLEALVRGECQASGKKQLSALVPEAVPRRLADALLAHAGLDPAAKAGELSRAGREQLVGAIKCCRLAVSGTRGFGKAEVTAGGVTLDEVDSRTMESKLAPGLHLAGEVLDLDGPIGGFNFQAAWSTGWLAGQSAASPRDRV